LSRKEWAFNVQAVDSGGRVITRRLIFRGFGVVVTALGVVETYNLFVGADLRIGPDWRICGFLPLMYLGPPLMALGAVLLLLSVRSAGPTQPDSAPVSRPAKALMIVGAVMMAIGLLPTGFSLLGKDVGTFVFLAWIYMVFPGLVVGAAGAALDGVQRLRRPSR
jgi:hypothetical protein